MSNKYIGEQGLRALLTIINGKLQEKVSMTQLQTIISEEVSSQLTALKESGELSSSSLDGGDLNSAESDV